MVLQVLIAKHFATEKHFTCYILTVWQRLAGIFVWVKCNPLGQCPLCLHGYGYVTCTQKLTEALHVAAYAAFTPATCSPDTSCIHLYPLVAIYMYPAVIGDKIVVTATSLVSASRTLLRTCVDGYKLLIRDTCIRLRRMYLV